MKRAKRITIRPMCMGCLGTGQMEGYKGRCPRCGGSGNDPHTSVEVREVVPKKRIRK